MTKAKAKARGKWGKLTMSYRVAVKARRGDTRVDLEKRKLQTVIAVLNGKKPLSGTRILEIAWDNPRVQGKAKSVLNPTPAFLYKRGGLETLNRGGWLLRQLSIKLQRLP